MRWSGLMFPMSEAMLRTTPDRLTTITLPTAWQHRNEPVDRKSTRLNSSHDQISYAVFCLKKKIIGGERYATGTQELKDYRQGLYARPPIPEHHDLRRLVLGREEPITIRPPGRPTPRDHAARHLV